MSRGTCWTVVMLVVACGGCSGAPSSTTNEEKSAQALAGALAQARAADADPSQIEVLSGDEVTFAQYQGSIGRALGCMEDAGMEVVTEDVTRLNGKDLVEYTVGSGTLTDEAAMPVRDECYLRFARYVDEFWQMSTPEALSYEERRAAALRDPMAECLTGYGVDVPAEASFRDLLLLDAEHTQAQPAEDCYDDIGYSTWEG